MTDYRQYHQRSDSPYQKLDIKKRDLNSLSSTKSCEWEFTNISISNRIKKRSKTRQYVKFNNLLKHQNYYFPTFVISETLNTKEHESKSCI